MWRSLRNLGWICLLLGCGAPNTPAQSKGSALKLPSLPGPARSRMAAAVVANRACERCHTEQAAEWRGSLHQRANIEPAYLRAFAIEPMPFCRSCHAPEGLPAEEPSNEVSELGVSCVTCHLSEGHIWAAPRTDAPPAPHDVVRDASFASPAACASCHEFAFPGKLGREPGELMQSTVHEHTQSAASDASCASCHMPRGEHGARSHSFAASRDPALLRASLSASAIRVGPTKVRFSLRAVGVGHAFPTGDLFRRLEVSAEAYGADHMVLASQKRHLTRHFVQQVGLAGKRLVADDRLTEAPMSIELDLGPGAQGLPVVWRVAYQRVAHPSGVDDDHAEIEAEIELARGELAQE